ncbi:hypothetical protein SPRG_01276 [Saprolegnia parasitica CBS 223.65]|uniref:Uncharacterized protein n=1 Tax=Saprolegnia parasitica (strain CBS 223.65) TaxID=695850 RepID=A0A067D4Q2_SAPPC|nr:hypothetical protein SPRG_01276 [Saprolegnia parasitica CBS 223.65]KDO34002.1 hypothetical protein SPRG_01276 [Saprolegnia parasitica CBS 223.65]|eukprot:XP_012194888.1 hypothetical protein SPRG_01276 [Saprolegnia parasitica CBS 223.65]
MAREAVEEESTCKYVYKKCLNARTTKKNGHLHSLCEYHRAKANSIQKAYATKKRSLHKALKSPTSVDGPIPFGGATNVFDVSETEWLDILEALGVSPSDSHHNDDVLVKDEFFTLADDDVVIKDECIAV